MNLANAYECNLQAHVKNSDKGYESGGSLTITKKIDGKNQHVRSLGSESYNRTVTMSGKLGEEANSLYRKSWAHLVEEDEDLRCFNLGKSFCNPKLDSDDVVDFIILKKVVNVCHVMGSNPPLKMI